MERCETCGGELELQPGTIIELSLNAVGSEWAGLAVIVVQSPPLIPALKARVWRVVMITGRRKGYTQHVTLPNCRIVHGFIHIARRADWDKLPPAGLADSTGCYY